MEYSDFDVVKHFEKKKKTPNNVLNEFPIYDDEFTIGPKEKKLHEFPSIFISQINTSNMFGKTTKGFDEEKILSDHMLKVMNKSENAMLRKEGFHVVMPGYVFLEKKENSSIGRIIRLVVPGNLTFISDTSPQEAFDEKRGSISERFLVTQVRHHFRNLDSQYYVSLEISRGDASKDL